MAPDQDSLSLSLLLLGSEAYMTTSNHPAPGGHWGIHSAGKSKIALEDY